MYVPVVFVLVPDVRRQGREGRKGSRKEECRIFTNSRTVTQTRPASYLNQRVFVRGRN